MKKLEDAVKKLEETYKTKMSYRELAEKEISRLRINATTKVTEAQNRLDEEVRLRKQVIEQMDRIHRVLEDGGYVVISQNDNEKFKIESGFTALEEIFPLFRTMKASYLPVDPYLGEVVYKVAENGMMTFYSANWDSSD